MLALSFSDIGTMGAIGVIIAAFLIFGFVKGMVRTAFACIALAGGILAGLWGFRKGEAIAGTLVSNPDPWMSAAVGIILGLAIFFVARALFGILLSPVGARDGKPRNLPLPGSILGLFMGTAFAWFCLSGIRYIGTLSELESLKAAIADKTKIEKVSPPLFAKFKRLIDSSAPGRFHQKFDILNDPSRSNLAKLVVLVQSPLAVATAATDKEIRDAIYETPKINIVILEKSADLKPFVEKGQYSHLLSSDIIKNACGDEDVKKALAPLDIEKALGLVEEKKTDEEPDKKKDEAKEKK